MIHGLFISAFNRFARTRGYDNEIALMIAFTGNATLVDLAHALAGIVSSAPLFLVPGYLLNRAAQVVVGREENTLDTVGASLALSIGTCPIVVYLLGKLSITGTRAFFWLCVIGFLLLVWSKRAAFGQAWSKYWVRFCIGLALLWLVVAVFSLVDWQRSNHVFPSSIAFDYTLRVGLVGGIARAHSLPPPDPFLHLGAAIPLGYHYFWFLLCSLVCREAPVWVGPRGALMAGTTWTALTLWAALSLWLRRTQSERQGAGVRWAVAALMLSISGLDLAVTAMIIAQRLVVRNPHWIPYPSLDWWSFDQVTNLIDALLWVPHCTGALAACATGLLLLADTPAQESKRKMVRVLIAGACFASSVGMCIYVAFGFAVFFAAYLVLLGIRKNWDGVRQIAGTGAVAVLLVAPYLWEVKASTSGEPFFHLGLRTPGGFLWRRTMHASALAIAALYPLEIALTLFLELGFFLLAFFYWRRMHPPRLSVAHRSVLILLFFIPLLAASVLRSDVAGTNNDMAMRAMFPAQFALAVMAGEWLLSGIQAPRVRPAFGAIVKKLPVPVLLVLIVGLFTTVAEIFLLRTFTMFQQRDKADLTFIEGRDVGSITADTRAAYAWLGQHSNPNAVVQSNPSADFDVLFGLYANRQSVVNGTFYLLRGRTYSPRIRQAIQDLSSLFNGEKTAPSDPGSICARWGVDYLVAKIQDPVWGQRDSWIWRTTPVYQNPMVRIYACSGTAMARAGLAQSGSDGQ